VFFLVAPGVVAGIIPWWLSGWKLRPLPPGFDWLRILGAMLIVIGLVPLVESFARFAWRGLGTPAPIAPPTRLVVSGFYRHVRNPMYVGVLAIVLGQALLFGVAGLLGYAAILWIAFHVFVLGYEEPALASAFGDDYARLRANVPRWIPRLRPWRG